MTAPTKIRLLAVVVCPNNPTAIANAAGDAVRALYRDAATQRTEVDVPTLTIEVSLHPKGISVVAEARRKGPQ